MILWRSVSCIVVLPLTNTMCADRAYVNHKLSISIMLHLQTIKHDCL
jgi:hypothetical protein